MNTLCSVGGCEKLKCTKGLCGTHYSRLHRHGHTNDTRRKNGTGSIRKDGYIYITVNGKRDYEHIFIAEKALGKRLPKKSCIHHVNGKRSDNRSKNLVICQDDKYHKLLHTRQDALTACGNASYRKCQFCQEYDSIDNLRIRKTGYGPCHPSCQLEYDRERKAK